MELVAENQLEQVMPVENDDGEKKDHLAVIDFKMVSFSLAGKDYAVDIMNVKEIAKAGRFTYVPNTSPFVLGVYNLRGDIIPIVDLRLFFNIEVAERQDNEIESMIIVTVGEQTFGVVVDAIDKVVGISRSMIQPPHPLFGDINIKYIYGVVESNDRLYILLDLERIFNKNGGYQESQTVNPKLSLVKETVQQEASAPETRQTSAPVQAAPAQAAPAPAAAEDIDSTFINDSLRRLRNFYVSPVNEGWAKVRYKEWKKIRGSGDVQIIDGKDADLFLETFYSPYTGRFWSQDYAEAVYRILPDNSAKQIVVWNPGCGNGYESYSLACLLKRRYPESRIRVYAHDTDLLNISNAPMLTVNEEAAHSWYAPYLTKTVSGSYTFNQDIKESVMFEYHDCMHANTVPGADIVFCRDLLSFLPPEAQNGLFEDFGEKLKGNGILVLGENESPPLKSGWSEKMTGSIAVYTKD